MMGALADAVLLLHFGIVLFVLGGLVLIVAGQCWGWVNAWGFRLAHLACIGVVALQAWLGMDCPLTTLELWLRAQDPAARYGQGFLQYWVHRVLYYDAPAWVFTLAYTAFGGVVAACWWRYPPRRRRREAGAGGPP